VPGTNLTTEQIDTNLIAQQAQLNASEVSETLLKMPQGAFLQCDEGGLSEHPSGSYLGNDLQMVTDDDESLAPAVSSSLEGEQHGTPILRVRRVLRFVRGRGEFKGES
jgi:hypothetical protein